MRFPCRKLSSCALWCLISLDGDKTTIKPTADFFVSGIISARMMPHTPGALQDTKNPQPKVGRGRWRLPSICRAAYAVARFAVSSAIASANRSRTNADMLLPSRLAPCLIHAVTSGSKRIRTRTIGFRFAFIASSLYASGPAIMRVVIGAQRTPPQNSRAIYCRCLVIGLLLPAIPIRDCVEHDTPASSRGATENMAFWRGGPGNAAGGGVLLSVGAGALFRFGNSDAGWSCRLYRVVAYSAIARLERPAMQTARAYRVFLNGAAIAAGDGEMDKPRRL